MFRVVHARILKRISFAFILAFFCAWFIFLQTSSFDALPASGVEQRAIYHGPQDKNRVALTFNISWGDERAAPILSFLKENNVPATFFLTGEWAEKHPELVEQIAEDGHDIGNLGYNYESYVGMKPDKIQSNLIKAANVFDKLSVKTTSFARPPNGHLNPDVIQALDKNGYQTIHWSINTEDWKNPGKEKILENLADAKSGDILLLHASDSAQQTLVALPDLLKKLQDKDLVPVTLSALIEDMSLNTEEVQ
ncbi:polysaccharide deacetylase family protein [Bacillaceae bacterium SIJ1]|uniref:polysaccharide deacetylase family protein n=1 Tax=Litoribacterium kuwaitense TaxID=1398745 RepID=UPI0013EB37D0|nr:polysaccharide deacetylase family protein [Litoribacterium kuwaitense]NGP46654.1 polysaccharide deacetylase family protein [Litoribacterium kuwaitense]